MAYEKVNWTSTTPINTTNLNKMDSAIEQHFNEVDADNIELNKQINDTNTKIGDLSTLNTTEKSNLVDAINEVMNTKPNIVIGGEPVKLGYQLDGKDVYCEMFNLGTPPNSTEKSFTHGISGVEKIWVDLSQSFIMHTSKISFPFHDNRDGYNMGVIVSSTDIEVKTLGSGWSGYTMYVAVCYTLS